MGGAPIGAGGHDPPLLEAKRTGGHNLGIIHISHIAFITLYTNVNAVSSLFWRVGHGELCRQFCPPLAKKVGVKKNFLLASLAEFAPTFKTVSPPLIPICFAV